MTQGVTQLEMQHVNFYVFPGAALRVRSLRGTMLPTHGRAVVFDDKTSFIIRISQAQVGLNVRDLTAPMNGYVFAYTGAPLRDMRITSMGRQIVMRGVMHKGIDIRFAITATPDLTADGRIRLCPTAIKNFRR